MTRKFTIVFLLLLLLAGVGANEFADMLGCKVNVGSSNPCIVAGVDYGGMLYGLNVLTMTFAMMLLPIIFIAGIVALAIKTSGNRPRSVTDTSASNTTLPPRGFLQKYHPKQLIATGLLLILTSIILKSEFRNFGLVASFSFLLGVWIFTVGVRKYFIARKQF